MISSTILFLYVIFKLYSYEYQFKKIGLVTCTNINTTDQRAIQPLLIYYTFDILRLSNFWR